MTFGRPARWRVDAWRHDGRGKSVYYTIMRLHTRLAKLERAQPAQGYDAQTLAIAPDLHAQVETARLAGTFPHSLSSPDLRAIADAAALPGGQV